MATAERLARRAPALPPVEEPRIVLHGVDWETYERLRELPENYHIKMIYDEGTLEMMSPSQRHEDWKHVVRRMIETWTAERGISFRGKGSLTWKVKAKQKGIEPDECYYVASFGQLRGKREVDMKAGPPPDIVIEVEATRSAIAKLPIYAAFGVPEVWTFDGETVTVHRLTSDSDYRATRASKQLPGFPLREVPDWIERWIDSDEGAWAKAFRAHVARGRRK
jgi:Uma2 family endonuclease